MSQFSIMSLADVFQMFSHLKGMFGIEKKESSDTKSETKKDDVPGSVFAAKFTTADESFFSGNLKGLLTTEEEAAIDFLETQMLPHQVEQFRIFILNMVNRVETISSEVPIKDKDGKDTGQKKTVTKTVDPSLTVTDARVLRLKTYAQKIIAVGNSDVVQKAVAAALIAKLVTEDSISKQSAGDTAQEKWKDGTNAVYHSVAKMAIGKDHFDRTQAGDDATKKAARLDRSIDARARLEKARREQAKKAPLPTWWKWTMGVMVVIIGISITIITFRNNL